MMQAAVKPKFKIIPHMDIQKIATILNFTDV
jgi:hypothetical protein